MAIKKTGHLRVVKPTPDEIIVPGILDIVSKLTLQNHQYFTDVIKIAMGALDEKDPYTKGHSIRVAQYSIQTGHEIGLNEQEMHDLELTALLHDIGKIGIPDRILKKPGRLTKQEFQIMQQHSEKGEALVEGISALKRLKIFIRSHHERIDGFGYPDGLKGEQIPLFSRIILIADTFDAMTSTRPYRKGLSREESFEELVRCSGTQFDAELTKIFIESFEDTRKIRVG
ncbi:MAG: HD-GYP domain-containing protein [Oligoflexia bacterium]|nr:HD-GYP domain-containing protein [Oligoflexia bacterium]